MRARLVGVPGSHPCVSAELMLRFKGIELLEGKRISGTMPIARALEHAGRFREVFPAEWLPF